MRNYTMTMNAKLSTGNGASPMRRTNGFTLVEVMIAGVILAIGLIGMAAVFPVVITQQRDANDLSLAVSASANAEALLASRMERFISTMSEIPADDNAWIRISAFEPQSKDALYMQMPDDQSAPVDLRLSMLETDYQIPTNGTDTEYSIRLPHRPLSERAIDRLHVNIEVNLPVFGVDIYSLTPEGGMGGTKFVGKRLDPILDNSINYIDSEIEFNIVLNAGETIHKISTDYTWLEDRLISHADRLYPADDPQYGWEVCIRKGANGQPQYCLFTYRFDGPRDTLFVPDMPSSPGKMDEGMLRLATARVEYNRARQHFYLDPVDTDLEAAIDKGAYLLPEEGIAPLKIVRYVEGLGWELEAPPTTIDDDGELELLINQNVEFWYLPSQIEVDGISWNCRTIMAYTKQVDP